MTKTRSLPCVLKDVGPIDVALSALHYPRCLVVRDTEAVAWDVETVIEGYGLTALVKVSWLGVIID